MKRFKVQGDLIVPYREIDLQPGENIKTQIDNKQDTHLHGNSEEYRHIHEASFMCR